MVGEQLKGARIIDVTQIPSNGKMLILLNEHLKPGLIDILQMKEKLRQEFPGMEWTIMCGVHDIAVVVPPEKEDDET